MPTCRLCSKNVADNEIVREICKICRKQHAIPERTEPMHPRVPCVRCGAGSFVRAYAIRERSASGGDYVQEYIAALSLSYELSTSTTFWAGREVKSADVHRPVGLIEAYACRGCGFTELYTQFPESIPIDEAHATEIFEVGGDEAYR